MEEDLDCFLFISNEDIEENRKIEVLCVDCRNKTRPDNGFFYEGSKEGYSNFDWNCCICNKLIHKSEEIEEEYEEN